MKWTVREVEYEGVERCPLCGGSDLSTREPLLAEFYFADPFRIPATHDGRKVEILRCATCALAYKNLVPSRTSIRAMLPEVDTAAWMAGSDYGPLKTFLSSRTGGTRSLLDVGANRGELLRAVADVVSERSALDVIPHEECRDAANREFIQGFLDDQVLAWSGSKYDVVTMFDVAEHLYDVRSSFDRAFQFLFDGGHLVIETGDANCAEVRRYGLGRWWYLNEIQHHMAYTEDTLRWIAKNNHASLLSVGRVVHKMFKAAPTRVKIRREALVTLYRVSKPAYEWTRALLKQAPLQPASYFAADHLMAIFEKKPDAA